MDRVGARNTLIVLLTIVALTLMSFAALLYLIVNEKKIPDVLLGITTTLLGALTGSIVGLGASPKVLKPPSTPEVPIAATEPREDFLH